MIHAPRLPLIALLFAVSLLTLPPALQAAESAPPPNTLTEAERAAGWRLLFDGTTTTGWRGFKRSEFPAKGWTVEDGCLRHLPKGGGGDIVTTDQFEDYELTWEWSINAGGNGGLKYFITEDRAEAIGHEYQMMGEPDLAAIRRDPRHATGSFYEVVPVNPEAFPLRAPGAWNQSRLIVHGKHIEHWLNGVKVVDYELGSERVQQGIAKSKFRNVAGFGTHFRHRILLQDHGGDVRLRNLKLLPAKP